MVFTINIFFGGICSVPAGTMLIDIVRGNMHSFNSCWADQLCMV